VYLERYRYYFFTESERGWRPDNRIIASNNHRIVSRTYI
jgi:hypothetical protein